MEQFVSRLYIFFIFQVLLLVRMDVIAGQVFNTTQSPNMDFNSWDMPHKSIVRVCEPGWALCNHTSSCFQSFHSIFVQQSALDYCTTEEGSLATVTSSELEYLAKMTWSGQRSTETEKWWMGYEMRRQNASSEWELSDLSGTDGDRVDPNWMGVKSPVGIGDEVLRLCVILTLQSDANMKKQSSWQLLPCTDKSAFLCKQEAEMVCVDRKNNKIREGERYIPPGNDACTQCRCFEGRPGMCSTTMCAKPRCQHYKPDPEECCQYICKEGGNDDEQSLDVSDNMRWVLTMLTSFILLGMMLFMVYRMRQKRIAYLHYRAQQMREGNAMDFEPGSGPPPPPNLDDIDGAVYREPPPPYSFLKDDRHIPTEQPPPYISTVTLPTDINRNRDRRSIFQQNSDAVALLDGSVGSEPNTPTLITGVPTILHSPPTYRSSTDNSNVSSPNTDQSSPQGESPVDTTPTHQTILPSINTTV